MMDRHCVNKMSAIVVLQPMDCQRAVLSAQGGSEQVLKEAWVENGLRVLNRPAFYPPLLAPLPLLNEGCSEIEGGGMTKEE